MTYDITELLDLKDKDINISGPVIKNGKLVLTLHKPPSLIYCPICNCRMHSKGIYTRIVNHPILQDGRQLVLELKQRRWKCINPICNYTMNDKFSLVEPRKRNSNITDFMVLEAFRDHNLTARQIAKRFGISDTYALSVFDRYVDMPKRQLTEAICVDEVAVGPYRNSKYVMIIQDFITNEPIDMLPSRRKEYTEDYFSRIPAAQRNCVKYLVSDMYKPYIAYVDKYFPNAVSVVDSFHVVKMINHNIKKYILKILRGYKTRDEKLHARREQLLHRKLPFNYSTEYYLLKKYQWIILKNQDEMRYSPKPFFSNKLQHYVTIADIESLIFKNNPELEDIRNQKEEYIRFNKRYGGRYRDAKRELPNLIFRYHSSKFDLFHDVADTLETHFDSIVNSFIMVEKMTGGRPNLKRLSNGPMEAINRIAKDMKRNGRGFRNFEHLRNRFLFSQRKNAHILGTPKRSEEIKNLTAMKRGSYKKDE